MSDYPTLVRIADALERIADSKDLNAYQRGRTDERAEIVAFLEREADAQPEPYGGEALQNAATWVERGDYRLLTTTDGGEA